MVDAAMESSREGMRALWISLGVLGVTALAQAVVVVWSGSVALLGDTLHNAADALTAVPLGIAFTLGRDLPVRTRWGCGWHRRKPLSCTSTELGRTRARCPGCPRRRRRPRTRRR